MAEKDRIREKEIRIKVTSNEHDYVKSKADYCGTSISEYARKAMFDGSIISIDTKNIRKLVKEINKIGVNINQIARHINERGGSYEKREIENLINEFENIKVTVYGKMWGLE